MRKLSIPIRVADRPAPGIGTPADDITPCERCLCASCEKLCMKCTISCSPMERSHVPLIGCPDFVDMRSLSPLRYTYRTDAPDEYRLHLSRI
jgi:hypothetical protein